MKLNTHEIRKKRRTLKKLYANALKKGAQGGEWLCDNFRLLDGALTGFLSYEKKHRTENPEDLFYLCVSFFLNGSDYAETGVAGAFKDAGLTLSQGEAVVVFLACAAVCVAVENGEFERAAKALFKLRSVDTASLMPLFCPAERLLLSDEGYSLSDSETKSRYRKAVRELSGKNGESECETVKDLLKNKGHIGFYLPLNKKRRSGVLFLVSEAAFPLFFVIPALCFMKNSLPGLFASALGLAVLAAILYIPVFAAAKPLFELLSQKIYRPFFLPSLDPENDALVLPETLITVSSVLPPAEKAASFAKHLEELMSSHSGSPVRVLALFDLKNSEAPFLDSDETDISAMKREIDRLNSLRDGGFIMAVRRRVFSPTENEYTGFERKRGAVETLIRLITQGVNGFDVLHGSVRKLENVKYVLALDADTALPFEELKKLLCVAYHPLNRAVFNSVKTGLKSGYGCFSPRAEASVGSSCASVFSRIMTVGGVSAYSPRVSERFMDMFATGIFSGKGLIDVDVYAAFCSGSFENGRVLSHDVLEGSLLRTAFVSHCAVTESFPSSPASYYRREDRWIRGDTQNAVYIFRPLKKAGGGKKLPALTKYQLADNLRRALTAPACFVCVLLSVFLPVKPAALLFLCGILGKIADPLLSAVRILFFEGSTGFFRLFFSSCFSSGVREVLRALLNAAFLPLEACVSADAVIKALYRVFVSRKKTLMWTTAADAEKRGGVRIFCQIVFPLLFSFILLRGSVIHAVLAFIILFFFPFSLSDGLRSPADEKRSVGENDYESLLGYTAAMWRFFSENAGAENNYLPPDNISETPVKKTALRTSPTNIGLYLLSVLAAADVDLISPKELFDRLSKSLKSVFSLKRYRGMLYNWYGIADLEPLDPPFVSSVDEGNYLVCLTALKEGLKEYIHLEPDLGGLIKSIENEINNARIETLYDKKRKLFSVGLDARYSVLSDSCYDFYMSEARMTSFFACAKRLVGASHWARLERPFIKNAGSVSAASYSGTMFEYFMPALFMPVYKNTYQFEGLKSALFEQKKRRKKGMPWGVSESGFYSFDDDMAYRYKAHGLKSLSLRLSPDDENVFSPYSSFLTFPLGFGAAMKNLRRFSSLGAYGPCGFYEAVDFSRRAGKEDYMIVRSFMAHHVGMSMIAAVNVMRADCFVKRFTRDPEIRSALSLLMEKIPPGKPLKQKNAVPGPSSQGRAKVGEPESGCEETECPVFSNGETTLICGSRGENLFLFGERSVFRYSSRAPGLVVAVKNDEIISEIAKNERPAFASCVLGKTVSCGLEIKSAKAVLSNFSSLFCPVKLKNLSKDQKNAELLFYFEPSLERLFFESEHPAFSEMGIRIEYDKELCMLMISRVEKGFRSIFVAVGFCDRTPFSFECDRERLVGAAADGLFSSGGLWRSFENGTAFSYPGVAVKTSLSLPPGAKKEKILAFCPAATRSQASGKLALIRRSRLPDIRKAEKEAFGASELKWAECFIKTVFFGWRDNEALKAASENRVCESDLWQQGISGDIPVIRVNADGLTDSLLLSFMKLYKTLRFCCIEADLVFMTAFPEDYAKSFSSKIKRLAKSLGMEEEMYKKNGIKALSVDSCSKEFPSALKACRGITLPCGRESLEKPEEEIKAAMCAPLFEGENTFVPGGYFIGKRPSRPWCHTLSNPVFGTLLSDCSLGYTWAFNSRQNKLTPWNNDPCSSFTGEKLYLETNAGLFDCVNGASVYYYDDSALYGARAGELAVRTEIRVDKKAMKKRIRVEYSGNGSRAVFRFAVRPMLCGSERHARYIRSSAENGRLIFENPSNTEYGGFMCLYCGKGEAALKSFGGEISVAVSEEKGVIDFFMIFTAEKKALGPLAQLPFNENVPRRTALLTGDKETDEFASSLLLHQVYDTRLLARTGFYQCSGAYGFRDQLQDSMNICSVYPERAKTQLLRCASAQFSEGDVLHWFHVVSKPFVHFKGVRTLCSDDMLWLPLAAARYVEKTGDQNVLSSRISFIEAPVLQKNERERYGDYSSCGARFSLYEHCLRAIKKSLATGAHGLPFISGGDWNDSFSEVGIKGRGGSVWLGMFLSVVCREFAQVSELTGDRSCADNLREISRKMNEIVMKTSYNGDYFIRGFYDDGSVLGGRESGACKIDLLVQAFAVFAGIGTKEERVKALKTAFASLYNKKYGVLRLFYPPFGENTERAGYVNDYPEGVRENAGQYTHAAVWFLSALKKEGLTEEYDTLLHSILPNCRDPRFLNEPYALTADVGMAPGLEGRGGWSLYTGAAGWLWRTLFEE